MTITVQDLIDNPHLKSTIIAGTKGLDREITWAHSSDLSDPSLWLTGGELILTNGVSIPKSKNEQVDYLKRLINAGASGIAIGKELHAPKITKELLKIADENAFPVLLTDFDVPWIAFSKTVATANSNKNHTQVVQTLRIYDILRKSINDQSPENIIQMLTKIINCEIYIFDSNTNRQLFNSGERTIPNDYMKLLTNGGNNSCTNLMKHNNNTVIKLPIPTTRPTALLAIPISTSTPDTIVLKHVATILGLIIERETSFLERQRRLGGEIFREMIEGHVSDDIASILIKEHGFGKEPLIIIICSSKEKTFEHEQLHYWLSDSKIPHLITSFESGLLILLPRNHDTISNIRAELPKPVYMGISDTITRITRIPDAYQEALWALHSAETNKINIVYFNNNSAISPFLPRNRLEAKEKVKQILGDLLEYDSNQNVELTKTLYVYLNENRSWKNTSEKLHIHKQTLVYRINRIEEITGYHLDDINCIAELWLALQAAKMLNLIPNFTLSGEFLI